MGLFNKKNKEEFTNKKSLMQSKDLLIYSKVIERNDEELFKIADMIIDGKPVLVNFDSVVASDCNFMLAFLSGIVYAYDGEAIPLGERSFLFARGKELEDGSLMEWVEESK